MIDILRVMVQQMLQQNLNKDDYTEDSWLDYSHYLELSQNTIAEYDNDTLINVSQKEITALIAGLSSASSNLKLLTEEQTNEDIVIANVLSKILSLDEEFEISRVDVISCMNDTSKELGITVDMLNGDKTQLMFELRTVWWLLFRFRNGSLTNYKYDTGTIGRSIDKTAIAKQIKSMMDDIDEFFKEWKSTDAMKTLGTGTSYGGILQLTPRTSSKLS